MTLNSPVAGSAQDKLFSPKFFEDRGVVCLFFSYEKFIVSVGSKKSAKCSCRQ